MGSKTDTTENEVLSHFLGVSSQAFVGTVYIALHTGAQSDASAGTEVSGGAYVRQAIAFTTPSGGSSNNSAQITFPVATANWGTISEFSIYTASSGGTRRYWGSLAASKVINLNDQLIFPITTGVVITED